MTTGKEMRGRDVRYRSRTALSKTDAASAREVRDGDLGSKWVRGGVWVVYGGGGRPQQHRSGESWKKKVGHKSANYRIPVLYEHQAALCCQPSPAHETAAT